MQLAFEHIKWGCSIYLHKCLWSSVPGYFVTHTWILLSWNNWTWIHCFSGDGVRWYWHVMLILQWFPDMSLLWYPRSSHYDANLKACECGRMIFCFWNGFSVSKTESEDLHPQEQSLWILPSVRRVAVPFLPASSFQTHFCIHFLEC